MRNFTDIITEAFRSKLLPSDTTLDAEIAGLGDDVILEMANLPPSMTGVSGGVIFISTSMGSHGPRVKFMPKPGRHAPGFSMTISETPEIVANSLPGKIMRAAEPLVRQWVLLNREPLLHFWNEGENMTADQVRTFEDALVKVSADRESTDG